MNPNQCKMARAATNLAVRELAGFAGVSPNTVARFERGEALRESTIAKMRLALETCGAVFLDDNGDGPGVRYLDADEALLRKYGPHTGWPIVVYVERDE